MSERPVKHHNHWTPLWFFLLLIAGVVIGFFIQKEISVKKPITTVIERDDRLEELIALVNERYVDSVSSDSLYKDAIQGILSRLDPHTDYIPAFETDEVYAGLRGEYDGIGIELFKIDDTLVISKVLKNSPADEAGLKFGDRLIAIDTTSIAGNLLETSYLKNWMSVQDNKMTFTIKRIESGYIEKIPIVKGQVPYYSVPSAYMVAPALGYIKISRFSANTYREFSKSLEQLINSGMKEMILDLRGNNGGYVDASTAIANEFLSGEKLIVYTQGRAVEREDYKSDNKGLFTKGELVVLIDLETASAAEILAGAIQDWDRGVLVGSKTFGKGLVQQQYELGDGSLLRLTVARYFTPSGRSIQMPYDKGREAYAASYYNRLLNDDNSYDKKEENNGKVYMSRVYRRMLNGNGGIEPDVETHKHASFAHEDVIRLTLSSWIEEQSFDYIIRNYKKLSSIKTAEAFNKEVKISNRLMQELYNQLYQLNPKVTYEIWQNPLALDFMQLQLKAKMILLLYGENDYYRFLNENSIDYKEAEKILNNNRRYSKIIEGEAA